MPFRLRSLAQVRIAVVDGMRAGMCVRRDRSETLVVADQRLDDEEITCLYDEMLATPERDYVCRAYGIPPPPAPIPLAWRQAEGYRWLDEMPATLRIDTGGCGLRHFRPVTDLTRHEPLGTIGHGK